MEGGMHGARDETGTVVEPGWTALGFPRSVEPVQERTWSALSG
jgi:hypothetical protein